MDESTLLPPDPLSDELDAFIADRHLPDRGRELDREPSFPRTEFEAMGSGGWLGLTVSGKLGGRDLPLPRAGALLYRLAYRSGTAFAKLSLQPEFSSVLRDVGSAAQVEEWFRPLVQGERLVGNQITEASAGSDVMALRLQARRDRSGYLLTGEKTEVAFSEDADAAIVYGRVTGAAGGAADGVTAFLVSQKSPGLRRTRVGTDLGERWQRRGTVTYRDVRVPLDARLGEEGEGFEYVRPELTRERTLLAMIYLGVARASWAETVRHVGERVAFGKHLANNEAVAFPLVEDGAHLDAAGLFVQRTLERLEAEEEVDADAALSKWMGTEVALTVLDHAIQFHGGRGYSNTLPHEQRWRDVRSGMIAHGSSEIMHLLAARRLWPKGPTPSRGSQEKEGR